MPRANLSSLAVVSAAAELADRDGFDAINISELARHFGVKPASIYSHVRDRAAVTDGVHQLALGELSDRIAAAIGGLSALDALIAFAQSNRLYATERPGCWTALQRPASTETVLSPQARRTALQLVSVLQGYGLPETEIAHAARFVGATINGYLTLDRVGAFDHRSPESETSWMRAIFAIDTALRSWPVE